MLFSSSMRKLLLLILFSLMATACETIRYEYVPPASDSGRICTTQCGTTREICQGNEINRAANSSAACERQQQQNYQSCLARNNYNREKCSSIQMSCYRSTNTERCDENYRLCYANCGGRVIEIIEK